jgi:integrase
VKFEDLAQGFVNDYRINGKRSLDKPERSVRHLQHFFGSMRAVDITTDKVRAYISDRLDDGVANGEINRELAALKRMFNLALQQTPPKVPQKPYIPMLQEKNVRKGFFEHDEFVALRAALPSEIRPVVTFAYHTGWRKEEVLALTWIASISTRERCDSIQERRRTMMGASSILMGSCLTRWST